MRETGGEIYNEGDGAKIEVTGMGMGTWGLGDLGER